MGSDAEFVAAAVAGEREAAAELIERHAAAVYAACLGMLADPDRAEDVAHDSLLKAIERLSTLRDPRTFRGWLLSIARNLCRDHWRRSRRRRELLAEHAEQSGLRVVGDAATASGVDDETAGPDLQPALARLPEKFRLPLLLYYFDGLSSARVGDALGISAGAAGARLCRARRALRRILEVHHD